MRMPSPRPLTAAPLFLSSCLLLAPLSALASSVEVNVFQGKAVQIMRPDGRRMERVVPADTIVPGDTIVYRYIVTNRGTEAADSVVVDTAIDPGMRYIDGSATACGLEFSTDGGTVFAGLDALRVLDIDGTYRGAVPDDVTNIRWRLRHPVAPGRPFAVGFRAVLT